MLHEEKVQTDLFDNYISLQVRTDILIINWLFIEKERRFFEGQFLAGLPWCVSLCVCMCFLSINKSES